MQLILHPKQSEVFVSPATEILFGGAAGPGKSHLLRAAAIAWCYDIPGLQTYLFRRTHPDLQRNHMEGPTSFPAMLSPFVQSKRVRINNSDNVIRFRNGSAIHLCHCQHEKDVYNYQGAEMHVFMPDEMTHFTAKQYRFLRSRVRMTGITLPPRWVGKFPRILGASNPGGLGHTWVKQSFIDLGPGLHRMSDEEGGMLRQFIPARLADNPSMNEQNPRYAAQLAGMGNPEMVKAMLNGDWDIVAGGAVDDVWDRDRHVIKAFRIPGTWRVNRSFDWGSAKPFSVGWWAESDGSRVEVAPGKFLTFPRGTLFRIHEWYGWNGRANEGCKMTSEAIGKGIREHEVQLMARLGITKIQPGPADSSIFDQQDGDSIAAKIDRGYGRAGVFTMANKAPGTRHQRLELLRGRLQAGLADQLEEPALFVFETCHNWVRTVPVLPRDDNDPDDVDTKAEDHAYDETGYRLLEVRVRSGTVGISAGGPA